MKLKFISRILACSIVLSMAGCNLPIPSSQSPAPVVSLASDTPSIPPTATLTPIPTITPTITPEWMIFRDDFSGTLPNQGWAWQNENPSHWTITPDGWLQIVGEDAALLADGSQSNLLWFNLPQGEYEVSTHLTAAPVADYQRATLYLYDNPDNYVAIHKAFCAICPIKGSGIIMEYKVGTEQNTYMIPTQNTDVYFKLVNQGKVLSGFYAFQPEVWERIGRFGNYSNFIRAGLAVSNVDGAHNVNNDLTASFDYFEVRRP